MINDFSQTQKFEAELLDKMKKEGWDGSEELKNIQWTFAGALFYSIIVITTIGLELEQKLYHHPPPILCDIFFSSLNSFFFFISTNYTTFL